MIYIHIYEFHLYFGLTKKKYFNNKPNKFTEPLQKKTTHTHKKNYNVYLRY